MIDAKQVRFVFVLFLVIGVLIGIAGLITGNRIIMTIAAVTVGFIMVTLGPLLILDRIIERKLKKHRDNLQ